MNLTIRKANRKQAQRGFTLVELMVALVVLTVGLFSIIHLQVITVRGHNYARERIEAYNIALGVINYLRIKGLEWEDLRIQGDQMPEAVYSLSLGANPFIVPPPLAGSEISFGEINSILKYVDAPISADTNPDAAAAINIFARDPVVNPSLLGGRGAYRVHYYAHQIPMQFDPPGGRLIRVTVFVSWESKDHGTDVDWTNWWSDETAFWNRHIVSMTTVIRRVKNW